MAARAPQHLTPTSRKLWRRIVADFELQHEAHALEVLRLALEAIDTAAQARAELAKHGMTYVDRFGQPRSRPEVGIERDSRMAAVRCFRELSLDAELINDVRPPRLR